MTPEAADGYKIMSAGCTQKSGYPPFVPPAPIYTYGDRLGAPPHGGGPDEGRILLRSAVKKSKDSCGFAQEPPRVCGSHSFDCLTTVASWRCKTVF